MEQSLTNEVEGNDWTIIKHDIILPEDFSNGFVVDRDKYVVEMGFSEENIWYDELKFQPSLENIGAILAGSKAYRDFRFRRRLISDGKFELSKTIIGKLHQQA